MNAECFVAAPDSIASRASSTLAMQQILTRGSIDAPTMPLSAFS
jgi:hypothetical protein